MPVIIGVSSYSQISRKLTPESINELELPFTSAVHELTYIHIFYNWSVAVAEYW